MLSARGFVAAQDTRAAMHSEPPVQSLMQYKLAAVTNPSVVCTGFHAVQTSSRDFRVHRLSPLQ